jgi:hypothetical protein
MLLMLAMVVPSGIRSGEKKRYKEIIGRPHGEFPDPFLLGFQAENGPPAGSAVPP